MGQRIEQCDVVLPLEDRTLQGRGIESYTPHHQFLEFRRLNESIPKMVLLVKTQVLETQCLQFARDRFVSRLKPDWRRPGDRGYESPLDPTTAIRLASPSRAPALPTAT